MIIEEPKLHGIMPTFRDMYPHLGSVGKKFIIKKIKELYLRDCIVILSKLSRHHMKYRQMSYGSDGDEIYRNRCLELLSPKIQQTLFQLEHDNDRQYDAIFPAPPITYLIKLCLKYCDRSSYTKNGDEFDKLTIESIGECLLITNSIMADQHPKSAENSQNLDDFLVSFSKQLIAARNFHIFPKLYRSSFLFNEHLLKHKDIFDIEQIFIDKYKLSLSEYFAFLFLLYSRFMITNRDKEDWEMPHFDSKIGLEKLKSKFKINLIDNLLINNIKYKTIDDSFYNNNDLTKRPFIELEDGIIIPLSLRHLFIGLTDSVYFDISDYLEDETQKKAFSNAYGLALEDYFLDIIKNIDPQAVSEFTYGKSQKKTSDAISIQTDVVIFFECKKRQFHNLDFIQNGTNELYYERLHEFFYKPLKQICNTISDFRSDKFQISNVSKDVLIYPVIVNPIAPPILSGAWDKLDLNKRVLPDDYKKDDNIALPEFIDFTELEHIEMYLSMNPKTSFIDLIKMKRADKKHHNANWMVFLQKNGMTIQNKRLAMKYLDTMKDFTGLLFN